MGRFCPVPRRPPNTSLIPRTPPRLADAVHLKFQAAQQFTSLFRILSRANEALSERGICAWQLVFLAGQSSALQYYPPASEIRRNDRFPHCTIEPRRGLVGSNFATPISALSASNKFERSS